MTKEEALAKFNRISNDPRQAQAFVKDLLDGKLVSSGTKLYLHTYTLAWSASTFKLAFISTDKEPIEKVSWSYSESVYNPFEHSTSSFIYFPMQGTEYIARIDIVNEDKKYLCIVPFIQKTSGTISVGDSIKLTTFDSITAIVTEL